MLNRLIIIYTYMIVFLLFDTPLQVFENDQFYLDLAGLALTHIVKKPFTIKKPKGHADLLNLHTPM
jgi:hypothetical protein